MRQISNAASGDARDQKMYEPLILVLIGLLFICGVVWWLYRTGCDTRLKRSPRFDPPRPHGEAVLGLRPSCSTVSGSTSMLDRRDLLLLAGASALRTEAALAQQRLSAVATFSILGDFVKNVGNDRVESTTLVGSNGDAHVYEPTPADARRLSAAKVVFVNGLGFEGWMTRLITASGSKAPIIIATKGITPRDMLSKGQIVPDPHAWQSVANARIYVANIRDGLKEVEPAGAAIYDTNAKSYLAKLDTLEKEVKDAIAKIPVDRRKIITTHDAFGYFGDAYGVEFIAPEGLSTESEPSASDIAKIITQIRTQKVPAVFLENVTDPRLIERIAEESGAKIGGELYSDALSEPRSGWRLYRVDAQQCARV
jgi:zinc/manganese transport system substrate-binding protein